MGREAVTVKLQKNYKQEFVQPIAAGPFIVQGNILQLYPKERVYLEVEFDGENLKSITAVPSVQFPERTLDVEFCQVLEFGQSAPTLLYVKNPFGQMLSYHVMANYVNEGQWMGVDKQNKPGQTLESRFSKVISSLVLKDWKLLPPQKD